MIGFAAVLGIMMLGFSMFGAAIWFSKYRTEEGRCCTAGVTDLEDDMDACFTCPKKDTEECHLHDLVEEAAESK